MTSSSKTSNYKLSQFAPADHLSWLTDYNTDMTAIDAGIHAAKQAADAAKQAADAAASASSGKLTKVAHDTTLTGDGTEASKLSSYPAVTSAVSQAKTAADAAYVPKTVTAPTTTGLTAAQHDAMYVDANGVVRVKPTSN